MTWLLKTLELCELPDNKVHEGQCIETRYFLRGEGKRFRKTVKSIETSDQPLCVEKTGFF